MSLNPKIVLALTKFLDEHRSDDVSSEELAKLFVECTFGSRGKKNKFPRKKSPNGYIHWSGLNREKVTQRLEKSKDEFDVTQTTTEEDGTKTKSKVKKTFKDARKDERNRIVTTTLGHQWSKLSDADKIKYKEMAREEMERKAREAPVVETQAAPAPVEAPAKMQCSKCSKTYANEKTLAKHMATHEDDVVVNKSSKGKKKAPVVEEDDDEVLED